MPWWRLQGFYSSCDFKGHLNFKPLFWRSSVLKRTKVYCFPTVARLGCKSVSHLQKTRDYLGTTSTLEGFLGRVTFFLCEWELKFQCNTLFLSYSDDILIKKSCRFSSIFLKDISGILYDLVAKPDPVRL